MRRGAWTLPTPTAFALTLALAAMTAQALPAGTTVVVDDRGRPALERLQRPEHRRPPDHLQVERRVEAPPHLLEDLREALRGARRRGHPPRQGGVQVVVGAGGHLGQMGDRHDLAVQAKLLHQATNGFSHSTTHA